MTKPARILIVDEDPFAQMAYLGLLHNEPYIIETAPDGPGALEALARNPPDVVLLDIMMPGMDGIEVCRRIKAAHAPTVIPVVLITALTDPKVMATGSDAGADDFLTKPVTGMELRTHLRSMLRIKHQYEELQRLMKLRDELVHMVVHDMRTPLQVILGTSELLKHEGHLPPSAAEDVKTIAEHASRLRSFVNDILLIAKMEGECIAVQRSPANLADLLDTCVQSWAMLAKSRRIELRMEAEPGCIRRLDHDLVLRVIDNLLRNALNFSPADTVISLRWLVSSDDDFAVLEVQDQGPGIPAGERERIFQKFAVVERPQLGHRQIGLGLAFCRLATEAHGGGISVVEANGGGALFRACFRC